ncbi:Lysosomal aspartic protease [Phytophthora citrophthora]|uniref:Lysosomal aspartic protease n=1 Tax=Phytophthora citrophthora TaxID=4793 RepID=A0AAD9GRB0_9STRA|nr:Lysosomal aspartic protease [Phytophthora citrophthora]
MMRKGYLDREMFSLYVGRNGSPGELMFGGYDSTRFKGDLVYIDCVPTTPWTVNVDAIQVGDLNISDGSAALISSMNTFMMGPPDSISQIAQELGGKEQFPGIPVYTIDCKATPPDVTFVLGGHPFSISKEDYILDMNDECTLALFVGIGPWVLGTPLLSKYYAVFDMNSDKPRIGFAEAR